MNYWLFQHRPNDHSFNQLKKVEGRVTGRTVNWVATRYASEFAEGDVVFLWLSGPDGGLEGWGRIRGHVAPDREGKSRVPLTIEGWVEPVIPRERVKGLPSMTEYSFFARGGARGTNFRLSLEQSHELAALLAANKVEVPRLPAISERPSVEEIDEREEIGVARALNDTVERVEDLLDVDEEAKAFARLIASNSFQPPLAIGVFGQWGSGKTFFMERIESELTTLRKLEGVQGTFNRDVVTIRFNAWHYMETNIWASLVDVIFRELDCWLRGRLKGGDEEEHKNIDALFSSLATAQAEQLDAVERYAERLLEQEFAEAALATAHIKKQEYLGRLAKKLLQDDKIKKNLQQTAIAFGWKGGDFDQLDAPKTDDIGRLIGQVSAFSSEDDIVWKSFRSKAMSPLGLLITALAVVLLPAGLAFALNALWSVPVVGGVIGLVAACASWAGIVRQQAQGLVSSVRAVVSAVEQVDRELAQEIGVNLAGYESRVKQAAKGLEEAREASTRAEKQVLDGTPTGRIAELVRSRVVDGTYSSHLGVIDTIRRDFEQLSALMEASQQEAEDQEAVDRQKLETTARIEAIRSRFKPGRSDRPVLKQRERGLAKHDYIRIEAELEAVEKSLDIAGKLNVRIDRIVLFIDDLDRCPPDKVYEVLQAIHLFLNFPLFIVVAGVDTRWMEASLKKELGGLVNGESGATPQDYLEKIFQIPYWTRAMDHASSVGFAKGILRHMNAVDDADQCDGDVDSLGDDAQLAEVGSDAPDSGDSAAEDDQQAGLTADNGSAGTGGRPPKGLFRQSAFTSEEADFIAQLAPYAGRSPRQLLRFVNVYALIRSIQAAHNGVSDLLTSKALLAQLAIATGETSTAVDYFRLLESGDINELGYFLHGLAGDDFDIEAQGARTKLRLAVNGGDPVLSVMKTLCEAAGLDIEYLIDAAELNPTDPEPSELDLLQRLRATAPIARRYTFAALDAEIYRSGRRVRRQTGSPPN